jgi:ABC-2 type transport system permease protein
MGKTFIIARRETVAYLTSPSMYVIAAVFAGITGYFFVDGISVPFPEATVSPYAGAIILALVFIAPALTMRLFAEELRLGTLDLVMSAPVNEWQVTLGKYLGVLVPFACMLTVTLFFTALLYWLGTPDSGPILTAYLGLFLYGAAALAVGLWASSITANQALAAVVGIGLLVLFSVTQIAAASTTGWIADVLQMLSIVDHFADFRRGVFNLSDVAYYVSLIVTFLFLCVRTLESRRWL